MGEHSLPDDEDQDEPAAPLGSAAYALGDPPQSPARVIERVADFALAETPRVLSVLDVGCGDGSLLHEIALRVPYCERYVGVEPDHAVLAAARERPDPRIEYVTAQASRMPLPDAEFDLVLALRTVHLWSDQLAGLRELRRVLRPGGQVVIVDRLSDTGSGPQRISSRRKLASAAEATGLQLRSVAVITRRLGVLPRLHGFILIL